MSAPLKATVARMEGSLAILMLEGGQELRLPLSAVEGTPKPGMDVLLLAVAPGGEDAGRQAVARHMMNELLNGPKGAPPA